MIPRDSSTRVYFSPAAGMRPFGGARRCGMLLFALATACGTQGDLSLGSFSGESTLLGGASGSGGAPPRGSGGTEPGEGGAMPVGGESFGLGGSSVAVVPACETGAPLPSAAHRYDFSGSGSGVVDQQGGAAAELVGSAVLSGDGQAVLDGDGYVNLPNGLLGDGPGRTLMIWATPESGPAFWRILDLGTSSGGEDPTGSAVGTYYIVLTPETGFDPNGLALLIGRGGPSSEDRANTAIQVANRTIAAAIVIDDVAGRAQLYFDGEVVAETQLSGTLSEFEDVNNWLGRSQYAADPYFRGTYDEFRVYDSALTACEISALTALGPDNPG